MVCQALVLSSDFGEHATSFELSLLGRVFSMRIDSLKLWHWREKMTYVGRNIEREASIKGKSKWEGQEKGNDWAGSRKNSLSVGQMVIHLIYFGFFGLSGEWSTCTPLLSHTLLMCRFISTMVGWGIKERARCRTPSGPSTGPNNKPKRFIHPASYCV